MTHVYRTWRALFRRFSDQSFLSGRPAGDRTTSNAFVRNARKSRLRDFMLALRVFAHASFASAAARLAFRCSATLLQDRAALTAIQSECAPVLVNVRPRLTNFNRRHLNPSRMRQQEHRAFVLSQRGEG